MKTYNNNNKLSMPVLKDEDNLDGNKPVLGLNYPRVVALLLVPIK